MNCWAACLRDCDDKQSHEHTVSEGLFDGEELFVQGFRWCKDKPKKIHIRKLVAKILCEKHNRALSDLDSAALKAFNVFREAIRLNHERQEMQQRTLWDVLRFHIDGPRLERWLLKTLINLTYEGEWIIGGGEDSPGTVPQTLVEMAFSRRPFENWAGMYTIAQEGQQMVSEDRVNVQPLTRGANLGAARFNFRGYTFFLNLLAEKFDRDGSAHLMYQNVTHNWLVHNRLSHVISIDGWK